jgi:hypothetical protein
MVDNQHKLIKGYRDLPQAEIDLINEIKAHEASFAKLWTRVAVEIEVDPRDHALARTHSEDGYYRLIKSVARPDSPYPGRRAR